MLLHGRKCILCKTETSVGELGKTAGKCQTSAAEKMVSSTAKKSN